MEREYVPINKDFCREKECRVYGLLTKLNLIESPSPLVKEQKKIIKRKCEEHCEHTKQELYEWLTRTTN